MGDRLADLPDVLTVAEVRAVLRIGKNKVYELISRGELRAIEVGSAYRVTKVELLRFLEVGSDDAGH